MVFQGRERISSDLIIEDNKSRDPKKYWKVNINCFCSVPIDQNSPGRSLARSGPPHPLIYDFHGKPWKSMDFANFQWFSKVGRISSDLIIEDNKSRIRKKYWKVNMSCFSNVPIDQNSHAVSLARSAPPYPLICGFHENPWNQWIWLNFLGFPR